MASQSQKTKTESTVRMTVIRDTSRAHQVLRDLLGPFHQAGGRKRRGVEESTPELVVLDVPDSSAEVNPEATNFGGGHKIVVFRDRAGGPGENADASPTITREVSAQDVTDTIRELLAGTEVPGISSPSVTETFLKRLSNRELEVLELTGKGLSVQEIANRLDVRPRTVQQHFWQMKTKLCLPNRKALQRYARDYAEARASSKA